MPNFESERQIIADQLRVRLSELCKSVLQPRQPITDVKAVVAGTRQEVGTPPKSGWKTFEVPEHWGGFDQTVWFRLRTTIPKAMKGHRVVAVVHIEGEALVRVNGKIAQAIDHNHERILLTEKARGGEKFEIILEAMAGFHDIKRIFRYADIAVMHMDVWDYHWDAKVAFDTWTLLPENDAQRQRMLDLIERSIKTVELSHMHEPAFHASIKKAKALLKRGLKDFTSAPGSGKLALVGHSHIDTAWLWPVRETQRKCGRTFSSMLSLMEQYPEFDFSCSQPVQYEWTKRYYPELYKQIKQRVKEGRWEPNGCFWVEPDLNVPSGESLVRQAVYGNRFFRKEFGVHSRVAWTPDTFGYCWSLPQILKKAQVDYFVTTKLYWNQFTKFPYSLFQWEGTDGTRIVASLIWDYNGKVQPESLRKQWQEYGQKHETEEALFPFGWGDGGGGPTVEMIETGRRSKDLFGLPKCEFEHVGDTLRRMVSIDGGNAQCKASDLPWWNGELYFELHRGCQTTQARTKRNNRLCEFLLRDAELFCTWSMVNGAKYDQDTLEETWKTVLTNQFHDILPGTSINEVYERTDKEYAEVKETAGTVRDAGLAHLAKKIDTSGDGTPVVIFNSLSWPREDTVEIRTKLPKKTFSVVDQDGDAVVHQQVGEDSLLVDTNLIPSLGYAVYRIVPGELEPEWQPTLKASKKGMENEYLRLRFDAEGNLTSVYDKQEGREVLPKGAKANVLQLFEDRPAKWEAWDIDFNFEDKMWTAGKPESIEVIEQGPVRATVRMVYKTGKSTITQDVMLCTNSPRVNFRTHVDWWEKRTLLKAAFPVDIRSSRATYEIQYGSIERVTHANREHELAAFEVPAQKWADLSEGDYGVSLLNDCKYGYDVKNNVLRISLLRSAILPDEHADEGEHEFTYALYPHAWGWRNGTVQEAFELNVPLLAVVAPSSRGKLPIVGGFADVDAQNVVIDCVKKCEDSNAVIVRVYEAYGQRDDVRLAFGPEAKKVTECDLMEENDTPVKLSKNSIKFFIKPYEIRTFKVTF